MSPGPRLLGQYSALDSKSLSSNSGRGFPPVAPLKCLFEPGCQVVFPFRENQLSRRSKRHEFSGTVLISSILAMACTFALRERKVQHIPNASIIGTAI
jgi:hypothetical protein